MNTDNNPFLEVNRPPAYRDKDHKVQTMLRDPILDLVLYSSSFIIFTRSTLQMSEEIYIE